jgi:hypothetical protein
MNTLGELISTLQDLAEEHGDDAEVLIASLGYRSKMSYGITDVVAAGPHTDTDDEEDGESDDEGEEGPTVVYLVESSTNEYLSSEARKAIEGY